MEALHTWTEFGVLLGDGETIAPAATDDLALRYARTQHRSVAYRRVTVAMGGHRRRRSDVHYGEWRRIA